MRDLLSENPVEIKIKSQTDMNAKTQPIDFQLTLADVPRINWPYRCLDCRELLDKHTIRLVFMDTEVVLHGNKLLPLYKRIVRQVQPEVRVNEPHHEN